MFLGWLSQTVSAIKSCWANTLSPCRGSQGKLRLTPWLFVVFWFAERVITSIIVNPGDFAVVGWVGSGFGEPSWCCCCFSAKTCCNGAYRFLSCLLWFCVLGSAPGFPEPVIITFLSVFPCHWAAGTPHQAAGRGRLTCFLLDCLSCSVQSVSPLWEGRRVPLLLLGKRPLQDAPVGAGGRERVLTAPKMSWKKKKGNWQKRELVLRFLLFAAA